MKNNNSPARLAATGRHCQRGDLPSPPEAGSAKAGAIQGTLRRIEKEAGLTAEDAEGRRGKSRALTDNILILLYILSNKVLCPRNSLTRS